MISKNQSAKHVVDLKNVQFQIGAWLITILKDHQGLI
jgi:uncharacterized membrane protein